MIKPNSFFATSILMENDDIEREVVDLRVLLQLYDAANENEALGLAVKSAFKEFPDSRMASSEVVLVPERPAANLELDTALNHIYYLLKMMNVSKLDQPQRMVQASEFFNKHRSALGPIF